MLIVDQNWAGKKSQATRDHLRRMGEAGHMFPAYDPSPRSHRVKYVYRNSEMWDRETIRQKVNENDSGGLELWGALVMMLINIGGFLYLRQDGRLSDVSMLARVYGISMTFSAVMYFFRIISNENMGVWEELCYGYGRYFRAVVLWPVYYWFWPYTELPCGLAQQLKLETAWRRKNHYLGPMTEELREQLEGLWSQGYVKALAELTGDCKFKDNIELCAYVAVAMFWLLVQLPERAVTESGHQRQIVMVKISIQPCCRAGPIQNIVVRTMVDQVVMPESIGWSVAGTCCFALSNDVRPKQEFIVGIDHVPVSSIVTSWKEVLNYSLV